MLPARTPGAEDFTIVSSKMLQLDQAYCIIFGLGEQSENLFAVFLYPIARSDKMPKKKNRKKYPKLPAGFGTIRYLGPGRRNCYAVHPPATIDALGHINRPAALCYTDDWIKGFTILTAWKAGTYTPGMEKELEVSATSDTEILAQRIIADYSTIKGVEDKHPEIHEPTFSEVFEKFFKWKFESPSGKKLSDQARRSYRAAFKNCASLHSCIFSRLKASDLQRNLDECTLARSSLELILSLYNQMYKYAIYDEICQDNKAAFVRIGDTEDDVHGIPFSDDEIDILWKNRDDPEVQMILIMCYSGFRISEYKNLDINLDMNYFCGGIKTAAGKNRTVPIYSGILPFVREKVKKEGELMPCRTGDYRLNHFYPTLDRLHIRDKYNHTPHDCRHTFSKLCERYGVRENDRKRMMGHSFPNDVTNAIYGHRDLEDLRSEIEKIKTPDCD